MRFSLVALALGVIAGHAGADPLRSDPAFLGIGMTPAGAGCLVNSVTPGTGAEAAGLKPGDVVIRIDGLIVSTCDELTTVITSHSIGDAVPIELAGTTRRTVIAQLSSRTEVMRHNLIGHPFETELSIVDGKDLVPLDLASSRGRVTILGFFTGCADCAQVFERVSRWTRTARTNDAYAVTTLVQTGMTSPTAQIANFHYDLPVALVASEPVILDSNRIMFMVIDAHGLVTYVAPVAPTADDVDAALDELFLAADHARPDHHALPIRRAQTARR